MPRGLSARQATIDTDILDNDVAKLEAMLGDEAGLALEEFGFKDIFAPGTDEFNADLLWNQDESSDAPLVFTQNLEEPSRATPSQGPGTSSEDGSSTQTSIPRFLRPPESELDDIRPLSIATDDAKVFSSSESLLVLRCLNKLSEATVDTTAADLVSKRNYFASDTELGIILGHHVLSLLSYDAGLGSSGNATIAALLLSLHYACDSATIACVGMLLSKMAQLEHNALVEDTDPVPQEQEAPSENADIHDILVATASQSRNILEVLSFLVSFGGCPVLPVVELVHGLLKHEIQLEFLSLESGVVNGRETSYSTRKTITLVHPRSYSLIMVALRIVARQAAQLYPRQLSAVIAKVLSDKNLLLSVELDAEKGKCIITRANRRLLRKLSVLAAMLEDSKKAWYKETLAQNHSLLVVANIVATIRKQGRSSANAGFLEEQSGRAFMELCKAYLEDNNISSCRASDQPSSNTAIDVLSTRKASARMDALTETYLDALTVHLKEQSPLSLPERFTKTEKDFMERFAFLVSDYVRNETTIKTVPQLVSGEANASKEEMAAVLALYDSKVKTQHSLQALTHFITQYFSEPATQRSFVRVASIVLSAVSIDSGFSLAYVSVLRAFLNPRLAKNTDFQFQLVTTFWDAFQKIDNMSGRAVGNLARLVGHLVGGLAEAGIPVLSYMVLKKSPMAIGRLQLSTKQRTFFDIVMLVLLTGCALHGSVDAKRIYDDTAPSVPTFNGFDILYSFGGLIKHDDTDVRGRKANASRTNRNKAALTLVRQLVIVYLRELHEEVKSRTLTRTLQKSLCLILGSDILDTESILSWIELLLEHVIVAIAETALEEKDR